ncbi:hypothetical protein YB2330_000934 [Saitoella coloradoensis]
MRLPLGYDDASTYTEDLHAFVEDPLFKLLSGGIHILDFFILNLWRSLPPEWIIYFDETDCSIVLKDLIEDGDVPTRPDSLTTFLNRVRALSIPRDHETRETIKIPIGLAVGMKPKKKHEVEYLSAIVAELAEGMNIKNVIDLGAGQGYLSRTLANNYGLNVLAIDSNVDQTDGGKYFDSRAKVKNGSVQHFSARIEDSDLSAAFDAWQPESATKDCIVIGLHACGSLTENTIRMLVDNENVRACCVVGCCYNLIQTKVDGHENGFPISKKLSDMGVNFNLTTRMTGCQAPATWTEETSSNFYRRHFFRALFQKLIVDKGLAEAGKPLLIGSLRKHCYVDFTAYVQAALNKLKMPLQCITDDETKQYFEVYKDKEDQIKIVWTLSAVLAPVIESVIVMDRYWFLKENNLSTADIVSGFDYNLSPRNLIVVGAK